MQLKKRQMRILMLMLLSLFAYNLWMVQQDQKTLSNEDFIRFHVIANSDSSFDQALKLKVRDGLLPVINEGLIAETMASAENGRERVSLDIGGAEEYITNNLNRIEETAEAILLSEGCPYDVNAELGVCFIPQKTYGNITFPAGNYRALNVTIGEGSGQNWWCVLFPPLCLIGVEGPGEMGDANDIYKDALLDEKYRMMQENADRPKTLELRFKTLELLQMDRGTGLK